MYTAQQLAKGLYAVGGNDRRIALFENMFPLPNGVSYNSYLVADERVAVIDTVDPAVLPQFLENVEHARGGRPVSYLVLQHLEPDHGAGIVELCRRFPGLTLVGTGKAFSLLRQFFPGEPLPALREVKDGNTLSLGRRTLRFLTAPMVHWPEVMFSYEESEGILFSADAFGAFGALSGNLFADAADFDEVFLSEARRYYANIVGKYGAQVQAALKKVAALDIRLLCPLHGPIWRENIGRFCALYDSWSAYLPERKGVLLAYASMYGHMENAAEIVAARLAARGVTGLRLFDVSKTHVSYLIAELFRFSHFVLAAPTYNNGLYPVMDALLQDMAALCVQNRLAALIGGGSWAAAAPKLLEARVAALKNVSLVAETVTITSAVDGRARLALTALADRVADSVG